MAYSCNICNTSFAFKDSLVKHKKLSNCGTRICDKCCIKFDQYSELLEHKAKPHAYKCDSCNRSFVIKSHLSYHNKKKCKIIHDPFSCEICHKTFNDKDSLDIHRLVHLSKKEHVCNICLKSFENLATLQEHRKLHNRKRPIEKPIIGEKNSPGGKMYFCPFCQKPFTMASKLALHKNSEHHGANPFHCLTCEKRFAQEYQLLFHKCLKQNLGEKTFGKDLNDILQNKSKEADTKNEMIGQFVECDVMVKEEIIDDDTEDIVDQIIIKEEL